MLWYSICYHTVVLGFKTQGAASNTRDGNTTVCPDDLLNLSGPITEDAVLKALEQRFSVGQNYVGFQLLYRLFTRNVHTGPMSPLRS